MQFLPKYKNTVKNFLIILVLSFLVGCATTSTPLLWRADDITKVEADRVQLLDPSGKVVGYIDKRLVSKLTEITSRISKVAGIKVDLFVVTGNDPNAFAWINNGVNFIAINFGLLNLLKSEDEFAFIIAHEVAHNVKGHTIIKEKREGITEGVSILGGLALEAAGISYGDVALDYTLQLANLAFDRDQEREADNLAVLYMIKAGYNAEGAISTIQKLREVSGDTMVPFLSDHPSEKERINNFRVLIKQFKTQ